MLFPIKHENMIAKRWPVITLSLILVNFVVFLCTHRLMDDQDASLWPVKTHTLLLAAQHPELTILPTAQQFVADFQAYDPAGWAEMQSPDYKAIDDWDARMRSVDDPEQLQAEMNSLATDYSKLTASSIEEQYAFIPAHPKPIAYRQFQFPTRRVVALDLQHVVLVVGWIRIGRRLGSSTLSGLLPSGRFGGNTT